ncbi:MAG: SpoIIE family protein phosphatase [Verrucomicrobia bacterium]|nr:SpoIIE family protein phosphatase [Verrucomicrobiota bacterium]
MNSKPASDSGFILANLMDTLSDAVYFKDRESRFIMINRACAEKHRWESSDIIAGKTDFDVFSREHAEQAFADEQRIIETGEALSGIVEKETWADGSVSWVSTTKMPLKDEDGKIIGTFGISRDITEHKEAELRSQRYAEEIRLIKEEMEEDVRMAGELQNAFFQCSYPAFPEGAALGKGCVEFLHRFHSCSEVSGDYCSILRISDTEAGIFLCDVQGIGLRAALGTALIRGIMQEISPLGLEPGAYLERMNQLLAPLLCQDEIPLDVTACYLVLDVATGTVRYASAGHPQPIHLKKGSKAAWLEGCEQCGPPLAVVDAAAYPTTEQTMDPGDSVVLFTDGLLSVPNAAGEYFGKERLLASACKHGDEPLATLFESLESDAAAFSPDGSFTDDVCLVGFLLNQLLG